MDKNQDVIVMIDVVKYIGEKPVLRGVNLRVGKGVIHVIAGPNGSGKTTTIRTMLGLVKSDGGVIRVLGERPWGRGWESIRRRIGYLPEDAGVYDRLTGWENLMYYALLYSGGDKRRAEELASRGAEVAGLDWETLDRRAGGYSRGMKRRLLIARSLMHMPELVVLDEPTSGLDVFSAIEIRGLIKRLASSGSTIVITTHNLLEAQQLADMVSFMSRGRVACTCRPSEALARYGASDLEEAFVAAVGGRVER